MPAASDAVYVMLWVPSIRRSAVHDGVLHQSLGDANAAWVSATGDHGHLSNSDGQPLRTGSLFRKPGDPGLVRTIPVLLIEIPESSGSKLPAKSVVGSAAVVGSPSPSSKGLKGWPLAAVRAVFLPDY